MLPRLLLLVDGMAVAYRAFHAIQHLSTRDGRPTNALFGFIKMLRQLQDAWRPTHLAVVFDGGLPASRMALLETYKAQRAEMPDPLRLQLEPINEFLAAARIPQVRIEGEEADDALATLAARARAQEVDVLMATSDKDLFQSVGERVQIVPPVKDGERMGPRQVQEKTGVPPSLIVPWLALTGDTSDNIPGVPGVGPKTAAKLLQEFGSLEEIWRRIDEVKPERIRVLLIEHRPAVTRNLALVTLREDIAGVPEVDALAIRAPDLGRLLPLLERYELAGLARTYQEGELNLQ